VHLGDAAREGETEADAPVRVEEGAAVKLTADEGLLRRALWNLVENAAKYGAPPIGLGAVRSGDRVLITVDDEGPGIAKEARQRVLEPFYRLDAARTSSGAAPGGFGLGLTFARRVAEVHGGGITVGAFSVADGVEHGCRVTLTLPAGEGA